MEALFAVSYTIKFMVEKGPAGIDYGVMPLEGLRWANDMSTFTTKNKSNWKWTMMIMQPDFVTCALIDRAVEDVKRKKALTALGNVRCAPLTEGTCVQIMPVGPFSAEGPTIQRLHLFIADCGCAPVGKHHEIHLSDIRKTDPGKWKAIIRQPMQ